MHKYEPYIFLAVMLGLILHRYHMPRTVRIDKTTARTLYYEAWVHGHQAAENKSGDYATWLKDSTAFERHLDAHF